MRGHLSRIRKPILKHNPNTKGQAVVEFTLIFILLLIIAWIPADFGLAFYTGQLAQNAAREGARIAAADPTLETTLGTTLESGEKTASCTMPSCAGNILTETAERISSALLPSAAIAVTLDAGSDPPTCDRNVRVTVAGTYNFFFYQLLHFMGISGNLNTTPITRETSMRWEHQPGC